ncbi:hypothetical protein, partial [Xanthomonas arboricola]|uniref:hypothetical protein n=1 Tax=Xanthomonas arboricola TaxID=56448 RepID=UPI0011B07953
GALRARIAALRPVVDQDIEHLLLASLLLRLEELLDLWQDCRALQQAGQQQMLDVLIHHWAQCGDACAQGA